MQFQFTSVHHNHKDPNNIKDLVVEIKQINYASCKASLSSTTIYVNTFIIIIYTFTLFFLDENRIFSWGNSNSGQLGIGDTKTTIQPHLVQLGVKPGTRIRGVICGTRHTFIWTEEGECFSFGNNFSAQLGYDFRKPDFKENQVGRHANE
jgi:alpha-tubulin suppressor-like RCC1 family protein